MPDLSSIENFKSLINSLGNEETILSKKGLKIENILPGKTAPEEDLGSLFSSPSEEENGLSPRDDFLNELDEIPLEEALEPVEETPEDSFSGSEIFGDDFSFGEEPEDGLSGFDQEDLDAGITEGEEAFGEDGFDAGLGDAGEDFSFEEPGGENEAPETGSLGEDPFDASLGDAGEDFSFEEPGGESEAPETGALGEDPFDAGLGDAGGEDFSFEEPGGENEAPETGAFDEGKEETGEGEDDGGFSFSALGDPDEEPLGETPAPGEEEDFNPLGFSIEEEPGGEKEGEEKVPAEEEKEEAFPAGDGDIFDVADFNLDDDISGQFGLETPSPAGPTQAPPKAAPDREPSGEGPSFGEGGDDLSFSQEDFARITATLDSLPRNLRLIIEEQIGDKGLSGDGLVKILEALKAGESPKQLAALTGKIIGRRIEIPAQYQKFSGLQFEEQRSTFAYAFKHNIWPIMRVVLAALAALGLLSYLVFHFIFTPLYANHLYRRGVTEIRRDEFETGNEYFNQASEKWRIKRWYYTYAEEYAAKLQYVMAEQKYTELLKFYPGDPKGLLDFARLESEKLGKYPQAEALIKERLSQEPYDEEALLLAGDNYIRWGDELDPAMYEEARYHYALLIQRYGQKDPYLFRMLSYLIRTDNYDEVLRFKNAFQANSRAQIEP
ncbi:MAG: hypothetical protein LBQ61_00525, partial [Spirochaetales bacterium]|nr:hypothetical protein [Spirochaetales bacterium]